MRNEELERVAQKITDAFFEAGATVSKTHYDYVVKKLDSLANSRIQEFVRTMSFEVSNMREPLPSANDHKEYNRGVRDGVEMIRNATLALSQKYISKEDKK